MTKFGTYTLPRVLSVQKQKALILQEVPLPGRPFAYRKTQGSKGLTFTVAGAIHPSSDLVEDEIDALADGVARILDFEPETLEAALEAVLRYQSGPAWTDNTIEAKSAGGTPFPLLAATSDYHYFGHREKFNKLQFDLDTLGDYDYPVWEYSKGGGWAALDLGTMFDDFLYPATSLNTALWNLTAGTVSVSGGVLTLNENVILSSKQTHGPFCRTVARVSPRQTTPDCIYYPVYVDANNFISVYFHWSGNLWLGACKNGVYGQVGGAPYAANEYHVYTVDWDARKIKWYKDGANIGQITDPIYIPTAAANFRFLTYGYPAKLDVDYVKLSTDATNNFTQDGVVTLSPPSDWKQDAVNSIANKFWLRVSAGAVTTAATVNQILANLVYNCLMLDPKFTASAEEYNRTDYALTLVQQENP